MKGASKTQLGKGNRALVLLFSALAWLLVSALAVECYVQLRWAYEEGNNPFLQAKAWKIPWPERDGGPGKTPIPPAPDPAFTPPPAPGPHYPAPTLFENLARQAAFFLNLDTGRRTQLAFMYGLRVLCYDTKGAFLRAYPTDLETMTPEQLAQESPRIDTARLIHREPPLKTLIKTHNAKGEAMECLLYGHAQGSLLMWRSPLKEALPEDSLWDRPFFTYKPHRSKVGRDSLTYTNNWGFRDRDILIPKPAGLFRILCIGGSTTEEGVSNAVTYPNLLEEQLEAHFGEGRFEVINAGIPGISSWGESMRIADYLALEPDLAIYYNGVNDLCYGLLPQWVKALEGWRRIARHSMTINHGWNPCFLPKPDEIDKAIDSQILSNLRFLFHHLEEGGVAVWVCSFAAPAQEALYPVERSFFNHYHVGHYGGRFSTFESYGLLLERFNTLLQAQCRQAGWRYLPLAEAFRDGTDIFQDSCHMRQKGIAKKAALIFEALHPYLEEIQ